MSHWEKALIVAAGGFAAWLAYRYLSGAFASAPAAVVVPPANLIPSASADFTPAPYKSGLDPDTSGVALRTGLGSPAARTLAL